MLICVGHTCLQNGGSMSQQLNPLVLAA